MIVLCNACHAKFRVADDKVGPRGVKVRCSKCQNVFMVQRDPASTGSGAPPPGPGAPSPPAPKTVELEVPADDPGRTSRRPLASERVPISVAAADPFDAPDPFAQQADEPIAPADDPFAAASPAAPFAAAPAPDRNPFSSPQDSVDPFAPDPATGPDPFAPPVAPPGAGSGGLALEEPARAEVAVAAPGSAEFAGVDPFAGGGVIGEDALGLELAGPPAAAERRNPLVPPPLPVARQQPPPPDAAPSGGAVDEAVSTRPAPPTPASGAAPAMSVPSAPPAPAGSVGDPDVAGRVPRRSESRLRTLAVNSVSLAALLLVTAALLAVWRGDHAGAHVPRERALLSFFGLGAQASAASLVATQVTNGLYETARGRPLLFVRGHLRSRSAMHAGELRVRVEIVDGDQVVGAAEGIAGVMPTPEDLWRVSSRADLEELERTLAERARPANGARELPFLVVFADYPADLSGITFRVVPRHNDPN